MGAGASSASDASEDERPERPVADDTLVDESPRESRKHARSPSDDESEARRKAARPDSRDEGAESLARRRLDALADDVAAVDTTAPRRVISELLTQLACKIDAVETFGDARLRAYRKKLIRRIDALDSG